jgi:hypothetical protein
LIAAYVTQYKESVDRYKTLFVEVGGMLALDEAYKRIFLVNIDRVWEDVQTGRVGGGEYKTTGYSFAGKNADKWDSKWNLSSQVTAYYYALVSYYGLERVQEMIVDGLYIGKPTGPRPLNVDFRRVFVQKSGPQIMSWLNDTNLWIDFHEANLERLCDTSPSDPVLTAFPINEESCNKFGCKFSPWCQKANPLQSTHGAPPIGYRFEVWDPRRRDTVRNHLDLTQEKPEIVPVEIVTDED